MTKDEPVRGAASEKIKNSFSSAETEGERTSELRGEGFVMRDGVIEQGESSSQSVLPPVDFSAFVLGLAQAALVHLGELPEPESGRTQRNLAQASHSIDLLDMLAEKTRGNLTDDEARLLGNLRRELKLKFVQYS